MQHQIEDRKESSLLQCIYMPVEDRSTPMSVHLLSEEQQREMQQIGEKLRSFIEQQKPEDDPFARIAKRQCMVQNTVGAQTPAEIRWAYDRVGRLKKEWAD